MTRVSSSLQAFTKPFQKVTGFHHLHNITDAAIRGAFRATEYSFFTDNFLGKVFFRGASEGIRKLAEFPGMKLIVNKAATLEDVSVAFVRTVENTLSSAIVDISTNPLLAPVLAIPNTLIRFCVRGIAHKMNLTHELLNNVVKEFCGKSLFRVFTTENNNMPLKFILDIVQQLAINYTMDVNIKPLDDLQEKLAKVSPGVFGHVGVEAAEEQVAIAA